MNIGNRIKEVLFARGKSATWLAERIACERSNIYHIFKRSDISSQLLMSISRVLEHDFFAELSEEYRKNGDDGLK